MHNPPLWHLHGVVEREKVGCWNLGWVGSRSWSSSTSHHLLFSRSSSSQEKTQQEMIRALNLSKTPWIPGWAGDPQISLPPCGVLNVLTQSLLRILCLHSSGDFGRFEEGKEFLHHLIFGSRQKAGAGGGSTNSFIVWFLTPDGLICDSEHAGAFEHRWSSRWGDSAAEGRFPFVKSTQLYPLTWIIAHITNAEASVLPPAG